MNLVGKLLQEKRESMNLSVDDIANKTRVQAKYIEAIENGDFSFFKGQSFYQQVFMGSYADIVGLNKNDLIEQLSNDKEEYEIFTKKSPVALKNQELEQTREFEAIQKESLFETDVVDEEAPVEEVVEDVVEEAAEELVDNEEVFIEEATIIEDAVAEEEIIEDAVLEEEITEEVALEDEDAADNIEEETIEEEEEEEVVEEEVIEEAKSPYPVPKIFDKYLQDIDVDTLMANQKEELKDQEVVEEDAIELAPVNEEISLDNIFDDESVIDDENFVDEVDINDDINKLIEELSNSLEVESTIQDGELELSDIVEDDVEQLNSSILDDIKKISEETDYDESFEQKVIDSIDYEVKNPSMYAKEPVIESTAVIDITSGIELEKIPAQRTEVAIDEEDSLNTDDLFAPVVEPEAEVVSTQEQLIKDLENTLENKDLFNNLQDSIDPDKTSMDLRVAKALGDAKETVDNDIEKEKKRFTALDYILIIVFIILVVVFCYIAFQYLRLG